MEATPPPYHSPRSLNNQIGYSRSNSLTQSATNVISQVLTNVGVNKEMPYLVNDTETICSICLEGMDEEEGNLFTVLSCSHTYHMKCIAKWKKQSRKCPCCRGPLPDEIGPTHSGVRNLLAEEEEFVSDMNEGTILKNIMLCPLGVLYPLCLVSFFIASDAFFTSIFMVLVLFFVIYQIFKDESNIVLASCTMLIMFIIYPIAVVFVCLVCMLHIGYALFRTFKFYLMVLMCKMQWRNAHSYIIKRTMTLAERILNDLFDH